MKSLLFYIIFILSFGFVASMPNKNAVIPKTENIPPLRPKSTKRQRDTTPPRLPDERTSIAPVEDEEIRLFGFDVNDGYGFIRNTEGVLDTIELQMNGWNGAFNLRKPVTLKILHFPNEKRNGSVFDFGAVPIKLFTIKIPVRDIWYGHFILQFSQVDTECQVEYSFWLHSATNFTGVVNFKPDFHNSCKFPKK
jgi:hypothetical protein